MRTHLKPFVWFMGIVMACSLMLMGCTPTPAPAQSAEAQSAPPAESPAAPEKVIQIHLMTRWTGADSNAPAQQQLVQLFNERNKNIQIVDESIADSDAYNSKLAAGIATSDPPHIFQVWGIADYARNGVLLDMKPYFDADPAWSGGFQGGLIDAVGMVPRLPGRYAVPFENSLEVWYYNTELFEKAGITAPPKTWDEFLTAIQKLNAIGVTPIGNGAKDSWRVSHILNGIMAKRVGLEKLSGLQDHSTKFTDPDIIASFQLLKDLVDAGGFDKNFAGIDYNAEITNFIAEKSAMVYNGVWFIGNVDGSAIKDKIKTFLMPNIPGFEQNNTTDVCYPSGWACSNFIKDEAEKAAMIEVIKFMSGVEATDVFTQVAKRPPSRVDITVDLNTISPTLSAVMEQQKTVQVTTRDWFNYAFVTTIDNEGHPIAQAVVIGNKTPEEAGQYMQGLYDNNKQ